jgi:hypothetical protein
VDEQLSTLTVYGGDCYPGIQATLTLGAPAVDGIIYYYKVISIITDGEYTMVPGHAAALQIGDTIHNAPVDFLVFNTGTYGGLELQVWAEGTPTAAGQTHPCGSNDLWQSNLLLCNEGLSWIIQGTCATEFSSGVNALVADQGTVVLPQAANGYQLQWPGMSVLRGAVLDMQGRIVASLASGQQSLDANGFANGTYLLVMDRTNGPAVRRTFTLVR